jgi:hypothetical protein
LATSEILMSGDTFQRLGANSAPHFQIISKDPEKFIFCHSGYTKHPGTSIGCPAAYIIITLIATKFGLLDIFLLFLFLPIIIVVMALEHNYFKIDAVTRTISIVQQFRGFPPRRLILIPFDDLVDITLYYDSRRGAGTGPALCFIVKSRKNTIEVLYTNRNEAIFLRSLIEEYTKRAPPTIADIERARKEYPSLKSEIEMACNSLVQEVNADGIESRVVIEKLATFLNRIEQWVSISHGRINARASKGYRLLFHVYCQLLMGRKRIWKREIAKAGKLLIAL